MASIMTAVSLSPSMLLKSASLSIAIAIQLPAGTASKRKSPSSSARPMTASKLPRPHWMSWTVARVSGSPSSSYTSPVTIPPRASFSTTPSSCVSG